MGMAFKPKQSNFKPGGQEPTAPNKGTEPHQAGDSEVESDGHDISHMDIHEAVEKHGPAHKIHIEHEPSAGKHHVESHHGKHVHHSDHASMDEAHQHAKAAAGEDAGQEQQPEQMPPASVPGLGGE